MNKKYIVEDLEFDKKFKNEKEIKSLNFKQENAIGIWDIEGRTEDEREFNNSLIRCRIIWEFILLSFIL